MGDSGQVANSSQVVQTKPSARGCKRICWSNECLEPSDALPRIAAHAVRREGKTLLRSTCSDKQIYHLLVSIVCIHVHVQARELARA